MLSTVPYSAGGPIRPVGSSTAGAYLLERLSRREVDLESATQDQVTAARTRAAAAAKTGLLRSAL